MEEAYVHTGGHLVAGTVIFHQLGRHVWEFRKSTWEETAVVLLIPCCYFSRESSVYQGYKVPNSECFVLCSCDGAPVPSAGCRNLQPGYVTCEPNLLHALQQGEKLDEKTQRLEASGSNGWEYWHHLP